MFGSGQLNPYSGPGKSAVIEREKREDLNSEKCHAPIPACGNGVAQFAGACIGCGKCVSACPQGLLRLLTDKDGVMRPTPDFRLGWCRTSCSRCAEACPTGALVAAATLAERKKFRPNVARWNPKRCVAATGRDACHACERHCPVHAITLISKIGAGKDVPKAPRVNFKACIGCGACEHYCPARPKAAMSVEGRA